MCYFLYLASPLTLSEVRAMLPAGIAAQAVDPADRGVFRAHLAGVQTVARLLIGACSCDLVRSRQAEPREDERHHRQRYRHLGGERDAVIAALERHRRGAGVRPPAGGWPGALAGFVAEHARNAGETLYHLRFSPPGARPEALPLAPPRRIRVAEVLAQADQWLDEDRPALVIR